VAAGVQFTDGEQPGVRMKKQAEGDTMPTLKIGAVVKQMDHLAPADLARVEMLGRIVKGPIHPPPPTHVWVEFEDGTVEMLPKGRLVVVKER
jgi:hypothetical protein